MILANYMVIDVIIFGLLVVGIFMLYNKLRRKRIWVVEDSVQDMMLFKMNIKLDDCDVRYFESVKGMLWNMVFPPDVVVCDYWLKDNVNGDQVREFFERQGIPVIIVTGMDGDIKGIPNEVIIHKSTNLSYFTEVEHRVRALAA